MAFWIGWTIGALTGAAGVLCLSALQASGRCSEEEGDGIQDDFTPAIARWNRMGRRWGWL